MDLTQGSIQEKTDRAKKNMMLFAMISMFMTFAGLTSAYIVSSERDDWIRNFKFPQAFYLSLGVILLSSFTFYLFKKATIAGNKNRGAILFIITFISGVTFVLLQLKGFGQIVGQGYYPTGSESTITTSFIYAIVFVHLLHILGGLIVLIIVGVKFFKNLYSRENYLGLDLAGLYWHFVDALWVYLFLFLLFAR